MSDQINNKPTTAYWIISGVLLVWNLIGLMFYYQQSTLTPEIMANAGLTPQQIAHITNTPAWAHAGYAFAVNAGVLGAILLLLRKAWAIPLFILSLVGALVQDLDAMVLRDGIAAWGNAGLILPAIVIVICLYEIWYARSAKARGWLT
ncbi:MAG: hypothetical protein P8X94_09470 [Woeseiaceae bacterium]|jgi:hypothetical protein